MVKCELNKFLMKEIKYIGTGNLISSFGYGTGSGSDFLTSSGSVSQKVTAFQWIFSETILRWQQFKQINIRGTG
jgi:hypothetical protein